MFKKNLSLGNFLKDKRIESGFSQNEIAAELGYTSAQFISNWERGLCSPPMNIMHKLIKIFKIDPNQLLKLMLEDSRRELTENFNKHRIRLVKK